MSRGATARAVLVGATLLTAGCATEQPEPPLRIALYDQPSALDPHAENEFITFTVLAHLYEPLVTLDRDLRVQPALAERWDNPSELVWRFHLRRGVRFHDGRPLSAADVVSSFERVRKDPAAAFASYLVAVRAVRATDPHTVEVTTDRPWALLLNKLAFVLVVPAGSPPRIEQPVGTGPYRLVSWQPARIELAAWEGYWGAPPALRRVELLPVVEAGERTARLVAGEVDLVQALPPEEVARLERTTGVRVAMREGLAVEYLQARVDDGPLADPRLRQAISLALDRRSLVDELLLGFGRPTAQIVPPIAVGYVPELPAPQRDLARARRLLAAAVHGEGIDLELDYRAGRRLEALREQLAEAGIRVRLVPHSWQQLSAKVAAGQSALHYAAVVSESADASDVLDGMAHTPSADGGWGSANSSGYRNARLDALIEASGVATDPRRRRASLQQCLRVLAEDQPFIPLLVPHEIYGLRDGLLWEPRLDGNLLAQEMRRR